ncbi:MAG: hypothetical protein ACRENZ_07725 [Thermodesulfobacteriota bacterium]
MQMIKNDSSSKDEEFNELRENLVVPTIKNIAHDLEQEGWYCVIGTLNPFKDNPLLDSLISPEPKPSCFTSLSIIDIEHRLVQYVYVFFQNANIRILGDANSKIKDLTIELTGSKEELEEAIRKVIDL